MKFFSDERRLVTSAYSRAGKKRGERSVLVAAGHEERVLRWPTLSSLIGERKKQGEGEEEEEEEKTTMWREKRSR